MDIHAHLSSLLQKVLPSIHALQPSAALYIFRPASADKISLGSLLFILLVFFKLPSCAYILLLLLTVHVATTCLLHIINTTKLQTAEELLSPAVAQVQLLKVKHTKLEAVIDQVSGLRASIAAAQQQEQELASAEAQLEHHQADLKKRLEGMDELRSRIQLMQQRLGPLPGLHTRFQMLRHKAKVHSRILWACKLLRAETSRMDELLHEYSRLKAARTQMQAVQADIAHAQREVDEGAVLQAHLHELQQQAAQARAVQAEIAILEQEAADLQDQKRRLAGLKAAKGKEDLSSLAEQGSVNKPCKPRDITNLASAGPRNPNGVHSVEGITTTGGIANSKAPLQPSLLPPESAKSLSAEGSSKQAGGPHSPTTLSGSKIPPHPDTQQQQHRAGASDLCDQSGSAGEISSKVPLRPGNHQQQQHQQHQQHQRCCASSKGGASDLSDQFGNAGETGSKIPLRPDNHHHQEQQQQQHQHQLHQPCRASSRGCAFDLPDQSGSTGASVGPSFNRSPNPVFQAQPQHTGSTTSSRASNASAVASFSTVRNPCYGDPLEACTPAFYTPAPFTPGPPPAFTPGPEAAAFAAALEAGLPLSQVANASKNNLRKDAYSTQQPPSSISNSTENDKPSHALDFSEAANALTPTSGASCLL